MIEFTTGDIVTVISKKATEEEWKNIGKVEMPYSIGTKVKILDVVTHTNGKQRVKIADKRGDKWWYPSIMFSKGVLQHISKKEIKSCL